MNLVESAKSITRRRSLEIAVRTAHIGAMALLMGGRYFEAASTSLRPWLVLTVVTGAVLLASEASHSRHWIHQARGVIGLAHVGVAALIAIVPDRASIGLAAAMIVGSVGSHLPKTVRKWSLRDRRVLD